MDLTRVGGEISIGSGGVTGRWSPRPTKATDRLVFSPRRKKRWLPAPEVAPHHRPDRTPTHVPTTPTGPDTIPRARERPPTLDRHRCALRPCAMGNGERAQWLDRFGVSGIAAAKINRTADPRLLNATAAAGARQLAELLRFDSDGEVATMLKVPSMRIAETFEYTRRHSAIHERSGGAPPKVS